MRKLDIARRIHQEAGTSKAEAATLLDWISPHRVRDELPARVREGARATG